MHTEKAAAIILLAFVVYTCYSQMPNNPILAQPGDAPPRSDLDTGNPDASGSNYQPAAQSGSGKPPPSMSYVYQ